jgi:hypothetical protein
MHIHEEICTNEAFIYEISEKKSGNTHDTSVNPKSVSELCHFIIGRRALLYQFEKKPRVKTHRTDHYIAQFQHMPLDYRNITQSESITSPHNNCMKRYNSLI